jgi:hypothetical protein
MAKLSDHAKPKSNGESIRDRHTGSNIVQTPRVQAEELRKRIESEHHFTLEQLELLNQLDPPKFDNKK